MGDAGLLQFVWSHVLRGAVLVSVRSGATSAALVFTSPSLRQGLATATVVVELVPSSPDALPVRVGGPALEAEGFSSLPLADLTPSLLSVALVDPAASAQPCALTPSVDEDGRAVAVMPLLGSWTLGSVKTAEGKRVSPMKLASLGKASLLAARGLVDTPVLQARKKEALAPLLTLLREAGFTGTGAFWARTGPHVAQAVEIVGSRWSTYLGLAFHLRFCVRLADLRGRRIRGVLSFYAGPPAPGFACTSGAFLGNEAQEYPVAQDTDPATLAAELCRDFRGQFLPWLDALADVDGIVRALGEREVPRDAGQRAMIAGLCLASVGRTGEAQEWLRRTGWPIDTVQRTLAVHGITLDP